MFEKMRDSLRDAMSRASSPAEGRVVLALMREAVVEGKVAVATVRASIDVTRRQLDAELAELETVRRRSALAAGIRDEETVRVAARYERKHAERTEVLQRKLGAQEEELALAEREVEEMTAQLKAAASSASGIAGRPAAPDLEEGNPADDLRRTMDSASRDAAAEQQLQELKRRMRR